jgi:hypothetical protein
MRLVLIAGGPITGNNCFVDGISITNSANQAAIIPETPVSIGLQIRHGAMQVGVVQVALPAHFGEQHDASSAH